MFRFLLLLFFIVPIVEIALFIQIGGAIGVFPTLALIAVTAVVGVALLRRQGLATIERIRQTTRRGELPAVEMLEGLLLLVAGAFLLTPGFFTDAAGFIALIPKCRRAAAMWLFTHADIVVSAHHPGGDHTDRHTGGHTYEGEYRREPDNDYALPRPHTKKDKKIPPRP